MRLLPLCVLLAGLLPLACAHVLPPDNDTPLQNAAGGGGSAGESGAAGDGGSADAGAGGAAAGEGGAGGSAGTAGAAGTGGAGAAGVSGKGGGSGTAGAGGAAGTAGTGSGGLSGCGAKTIKINEFAVAGPNGPNDEFVELYNSGTCELSLDGWVLKYSSKSGSSPQTYWTGASKDSIPSGGFFLLGSSDYSGSLDGKTMGNMSADGGAIGIFSSDGPKTPLDGVAWKAADASNDLAEGDPCDKPAADKSVARHHDGEDTQDNATDFDSSATPTPGEPN